MLCHLYKEEKDAEIWSKEVTTKDLILFIIIIIIIIIYCVTVKE